MYLYALSKAKKNPEKIHLSAEYEAENRRNNVSKNDIIIIVVFIYVKSMLLFMSKVSRSCITSGGP